MFCEREKFLRLTPSGREKLMQSEPYWQRAQRRLRERLGMPGRTQMGGLLAEVTGAAAERERSVCFTAFLGF